MSEKVRYANCVKNSLQQSFVLSAGSAIVTGAVGSFMKCQRRKDIKQKPFPKA